MKKTITFITIVGFCLVLVGCGSKDKDDTNSGSVNVDNGKDSTTIVDEEGNTVNIHTDNGTTTATDADGSSVQVDEEGNVKIETPDGSIEVDQ